MIVRFTTLQDFLMVQCSTAPTSAAGHWQCVSALGRCAASALLIQKMRLAVWTFLAITNHLMTPLFHLPSADPPWAWTGNQWRWRCAAHACWYGYELRNRSIGMLYLYPNLTVILLQVGNASLWYLQLWRTGLNQQAASQVNFRTLTWKVNKRPLWHLTAPQRSTFRIAQTY